VYVSSLQGMVSSVSVVGCADLEGMRAKGKFYSRHQIKSRVPKAWATGTRFRKRKRAGVCTPRPSR